MQNRTIFQTFEWNLPATHSHYTSLLSALPTLHRIGLTALWLPPACKAGNSSGNGYDIYDLYDLGEFNQRGSLPTKWGTKQDLMALAEKAHELGVDLYFDAVLNHRCGGDDKEVIRAVEVCPKNRHKNLCEEKEVEAWLRFEFPGREGKYSEVRYDWRMFNASDWDDRSQKHGIWKIVDDGKQWAKDVSRESGNGDYLMFNNLDYCANEVLREDVKNWGVWVTRELGLKGFRLDAVQHVSQTFSTEWVEFVRREIGEELFVVGEYWNGDVDTLVGWLDAGSPQDMYLYDAPLLYNFGRLSYERMPDLRTVFERTLVGCRPDNAVTLVMNHDTQKGQVMDTPIHPKFTSLAYSLILFREAGYPCVFYGDMFGTSQPHVSPPTCDGKLADLILARKLYAYGEQKDYFHDAECIGWVRRGISGGEGSQSAGMAVVMNWVGGHKKAQQEVHDSSHRPRWMRRLPGIAAKWGMSVKRPNQCQRRMNVGVQHAGEVWTDILEGCSRQVMIGRDGYGVFPCELNSVAVYVSSSAAGRQEFPVAFNSRLC
ncbi:glycoside hydrolase family 13 protein [Periconia macrospinosa]|uniref:Glycoside hydrolase family 13 protein n=1 Tax=Periconia macrospinosa TaxID=97972 RepID=A0A2V1DBB6_9PLEO|nr:glycoside hydrolase family 13 protein [Periconia macrospinosa]